MFNFNHLRSHIVRPVAALAAAAMLIPLAACGSSQTGGSASSSDATDSIRVAYLSTANFLTTVKDESFLAETMAPYKADFSGPYNPPDDAYKVILAGKADTSSTGTGYFINLVDQKAPWVAYAIEYYTGDSQGLVAAPGSNVTKLEDLYGKRVGIDKKGATGDYILKAAFEKAGLDYSKVEEVELSQTDFSAAFSSGRIDALATYDQNLAAAIATPGAKLITTGKDYDSKNVTLHMVSRKFATAHPEIVKKLYQALVKESDRAQNDPEFIYDAYKKFGASDGIVDQVRKFDVPEILPVDAKGRQMLEDIAQQYVDFGFIKSKPDLTDYVLDCTK
ncbi:ABC transporter substrate-binding protein [Bifidobacterium vespertilionis]|uniref:Transporter substrate-binding domain-containing protein n=1 Tax=Bifidobacterium vespertilionis TaxID=2562524 RepID=A0A5J5E6Z7_9BIFI|nr:NrtA/SsuA/CpmA family ABC transporter substrate-binding protein [Bifidobacterium vespertilionis]KAA8821662.1 transporter substrate-binding domain-containing protein [Bifidobacterium vespertilionis]KAA8824742.1 transporter substrate-binding domain-containing protein [Bifidobacterium vespertilionis]